MSISQACAAPFLALASAVLLSGCLARTALDVATAPVRAAGQAADWATTSQDEADRARGREIRRREERLGDLQEEYDDLANDCADGEDDACRKAVAVRREIDELLPQVPVEPEGR